MYKIYSLFPHTSYSSKLALAALVRATRQSGLEGLLSLLSQVHVFSNAHCSPSYVPI
jgi:hypothetical protein